MEFTITLDWHAIGQWCAAYWWVFIITYYIISLPVCKFLIKWFNISDIDIPYAIMWIMSPIIIILGLPLYLIFLINEWLDPR
jgi:hypothetical protein